VLTGERDAVESLAMFGVPLRVSSSCMHGPPPPAVGVARAMRRHHEKKRQVLLAYFFVVVVFVLSPILRLYKFASLTIGSDKSRDAL
jgi:hypothetical protein